MTAALLVGAAVGFGLYLAVGALAPTRPPLALALARLHRPHPPIPTAGSRSPIGRAAKWTADTLGVEGLLESSTASDRRVVGRSLEDHAVASLTAAMIGAGLPAATAVLMAAGGLAPPWPIPAVLSICLAVAGFLVPTVTLRAEAGERRRSFRHALSSYLDLVAVTLAGGAGVETALHRAAATGQGWVFDEIRQALAASRLHRQTPWAGLDQLGADLGVPDLRELAASAALAGEDGARVRVSIAAKARALRTRGVTETEAHAQAATERMSLPIVVLMMGFVILVVYPAIARILTGL